MSTAGIQMHFSTLLMNDRPRSFCIVSDNAHALTDAAAESFNKSTPRRTKSASRNSAPGRINRPYSSGHRSRGNNNSYSYSSISSCDSYTATTTDDSDVPIAATAASRWSSVPDRSSDMTLNKPPRRGLSNESQEQLQTLAATKNRQQAPPTMPRRKMLDDESLTSYSCSMSSCSTNTDSSFSSACAVSSYSRRTGDMSLAHCIAHHKTATAGAGTDRKPRTTRRGIRSIRRPGKGSEHQRRNIVDILDAALGSLDLEDSPEL